MKIVNVPGDGSHSFKLKLVKVDSFSRTIKFVDPSGIESPLLVETTKEILVFEDGSPVTSQLTKSPLIDILPRLVNASLMKEQSASSCGESLPRRTS